MTRKERTKPRRHKGEISLKDRLDVYWRRNKRKLFPRKLIYIVLTIDYQLIRERALREFLIRENLNFDNFYQMVNAAKNILEKKPSLKAQFLKQCFDICTENNLVELEEVGVSGAIKELFRRIEKRSVSNRKALQVLIRFFQKNRDAKVRMELWKKIEKLGPNQEDSRYLLNLPGMYALPKITSRIQKFIRRQNEKEKTKILKTIEKFVKEIKIEKGQS